MQTSLNVGGGPCAAMVEGVVDPSVSATRCHLPVPGGFGMIQLIAFYLFATLVILSGALTILARNPVHSVLWLIMAFFNAAGLMVLVGAEFIAMLLVIVYVGAVAVLFLFVVMMLDIDFAELRAGFIRNFPLGHAARGGAAGRAVRRHRRLPGRGAGARHARRQRRAGPGREQHRGDRRAAVRPLPVPVRGGGDHPAGRHDRRDRADPPRAQGHPLPERRRARSRRRPARTATVQQPARSRAQGVRL